MRGVIGSGLKMGWIGKFGFGIEGVWEIRGRQRGVRIDLTREARFIIEKHTM